LVLLIALCTSALSQEQAKIETFKDSDSNVRASIAEILGIINDSRAVEPLIQALKDNNSDVRAKTAWALGNINDSEAVEPLIQALNDNNSNCSIDIRSPG